MTLPLEPDLETRVANIETTLASIQLALDSLRRAPESRAERESSFVPRTPTRPRPTRVPTVHTEPVETGAAKWLTERTPEWWVGALGTLFLIISLFLLYRYAVDRNWITPLIRVLTGVAVGGGLVTAAIRLTVPKPAESNNHLGLREILLGGGIAAWYARVMPQRSTIS